ncbi:PrgI family protein [Actinomycetes bacterium KLBMP 9797]
MGLQAPVPADIDQPDRILFGLTVRQVAILAAAGAVLWVGYQALTPLVSPLLVAAGMLPVAAVVATVVLGRRDGVFLDRWLLAWLRTARSPRRLVPAAGGGRAAPWWAPEAPVPVVAPLRLAATAVDEDGVVDLRDGGRVALTAVSTLTFGMRSPADQAALLGGYASWLHGLIGPVQIVVSTRGVDMDAYAVEVESRVDGLPHPALARAAYGYAQFLRWLGEQRDPLVRRVTVAHKVAGDGRVARRHAEHTARALSGLGVDSRVLDGGLVCDVLAGACRPWQTPTDGHARPGAVVTGDAEQERA